MSWEDFEDYYEPSEFDSKVEELKDYLRESVKGETRSQIERLELENKRLLEENKTLKEKNITVENENKAFATDDIITKLITKKFSKENVYEVINILFEKTFNEKPHRDCPDFWLTFVNYYNNRTEILSLLRYASIEIPSELDEIILPHEWNEEMLDKFFDTMHKHSNCNGEIYKDNLRFWNYKMDANPFKENRYSSCSEIPWQFVLRNPLLNTEKYALKIIEEMNKKYNSNGLKFWRICQYQELDKDILQMIVDGIEVREDIKKDVLVDFLEEHTDMVTQKDKLDFLYPIFAKKWRGEESILKMPKEYQIKYAKSLDRADKKIEFLNKTQLTKEEKTEIISDMF